MATNHIRLVENYRDDPVLRDAFFSFTETIFRLSFREWYRRGFWSDRYICSSLFDGSRIIANVSFSKLDLLINGEPKKGIQIATVGTLPDLRKRGLARELMHHVLKHHAADADLVFLFANDTVLDFYPRFEFERRREELFVLDTIPRPSKLNIRHLNLDKPEDTQLINDLLSVRMPITTRFGAENYGFITWWHLINLFKKHIYYCKDFNAVFVASIDNDFLCVWDAISSEPFDIESAVASLPVAGDAKSLMYCFGPDGLNYQYDRTETSDDSPLFVRGDFKPGNEPFKFPTTAQT